MTFLSDLLLPWALAVGLPLLIAGAPETARPVLVIAPPGSDTTRLLDIIGQADGRILRGAGLAWMAVAASERSDLPRRPRDAGA